MAISWKKIMKYPNLPNKIACKIYLMNQYQKMLSGCSYDLGITFRTVDGDLDHDWAIVDSTNFACILDEKGVFEFPGGAFAKVERNLNKLIEGGK